MKPMYVFLFTAAIGNFAYHLGQKTLPQTTNPMAILMIVYALAFVLSGLMLPYFSSEQDAAWQPLIFNWRVWLVALGVLLIEVGFLLAYRGGGSVQWSGVAVNGIAAVLLIPVAVLLFKEPLSIERIVGIVVTLFGLYLLVKD